MVAGGSGERFGGPKQFLELAGRPVVSWSVAAARAVADGVVAVVPAPLAGVRPGLDHPLGGRLGEGPGIGADRVVTGGSTRAGSVRAGLAAVPRDAGVVVVHDAVRPLAPASLFERVVAAVRDGADGAVPAVAVGDTLKRVADGRVLGTVDRHELVAVQTPQAFAAGVLREAHAGDPEATDDAALLERIGATVRTVEGDPRNLKLTHPGDVEVLEALLGAPSRRHDG